MAESAPEQYGVLTPGRDVASQQTVHRPRLFVDALQVVLMGRFPRLGWLRRPGKDDKRAAAEARG